MITVVNIGYGASYIINVKDISPLLEIINRSTPVTRRWADGAHWVTGEEGAGKVQVEQDDKPVITREEFDVIAERVEEARKAKEEAKAREEAEF